MSKVIKGVFLSDLHMSDLRAAYSEAINLKGVFNYLKDFMPDVVILGGDIVDAKNLHGIDHFSPADFKMEWYKRDVTLLSNFLGEVAKVCPTAKVIMLEGNHEERYHRLSRRYPDLFKGVFDFHRDAFPASLKGRSQYIPYGTYKSFYKVGDCMFVHGDVYPDAHAKKYAQTYLPYKVWYGHLHDCQIYTQHVAGPHIPARYAGTAGCLSKRAPDWKKGQANKWLNGFADFMCVDGVTTVTPHFIERGKFYIGAKIYSDK